MPLFSIPLDHIVVDELHLLLRITDRLEKGLIMAAISNDEVNDSINIKFFNIKVSVKLVTFFEMNTLF